MICVSNFIVLPIKVDTTEGITILGKYLIFTISEYFLVMELALVLASIPCPYLTVASENNTTYFFHYVLFIHSSIYLLHNIAKVSCLFWSRCFVFLWFFVCLALVFLFCFGFPPARVSLILVSLRNVLTKPLTKTMCMVISHCIQHWPW